MAEQEAVIEPGGFGQCLRMVSTYSSLPLSSVGGFGLSLCVQILYCCQMYENKYENGKEECLYVILCII